MSTAEPKQKRHWPYMFYYTYEDEDRGIVYYFSVNGCLHDNGDFDYQIASLDMIRVKGERKGEPDITNMVTDHEADEAYRKWFEINRVDNNVIDVLSKLCKHERDERLSPDYGI